MAALKADLMESKLVVEMVVSMVGKTVHWKVEKMVEMSV